jgi:hypothetical protein
MMATYLPIAIFTTLIFILINALLLPLAYLKALLHKVLIAFKIKSKETLVDLYRFFAYGFFIIAVGQVYEAKYFF